MQPELKIEKQGHKEEDKSLKEMVEKIKINYAIMLLQKYGKPSSD